MFFKPSVLLLLREQKISLILALFKTQWESKHCFSLWHLPLPTVCDSDFCLITIPVLLTWELIFLRAYGTAETARCSLAHLPKPSEEITNDFTALVWLKINRYGPAPAPFATVEITFLALTGSCF